MRRLLGSDSFCFLWVQLIGEGKIDDALQALSMWYPGVLQVRLIVFSLHSDILTIERGHRCKFS
jgi:hypothetical protein